jgi:hypothetical protein
LFVVVVIVRRRRRSSLSSLFIVVVYQKKFPNRNSISEAYKEFEYFLRRSGAGRVAVRVYHGSPRLPPLPMLCRFSQ